MLYVFHESARPLLRVSDSHQSAAGEREMEDTSVDFFLKTLKQLIRSPKLDSIVDEKHQLQSLEEEIKYLRGFLKVTEKNRHKQVMKLGMEIRAMVSEAENIVEQFVIDAFKADHLSLHLESVKKKIKTLTAKVKQIHEENICYLYGVAVKKFKHSSARSGGRIDSSGESNTSKVVKEKVVVGFEDEVKALLEKLDDKGESRLLEIITIIGAAGGGKTTLAREVFHHPLTSYTFEIRAWVDVSQNYDKTTKKDLLIRVLKSAFPENHEDYENSSEDMLGEKVLRSLKGRKYLIVMDDIWGIEAWNDIQRSYPNERKGSKVLFTSRQLVQLDSVHFVTHYLDPLPKHRSWELLQMKVFGVNCCPPELVDIGVEIAEKCEGLPLAIVAIAGILETKDKSVYVWKEVAEHLSSIIAINKEAGCMEVLELSYNHLPRHLKACFLYAGAFLQVSEIRVRELLWLWIAEGFIQQSEKGKSLEAVARDHLIDLINRSLMMVATKSSLGGIKACRIHDLLRIFCVKKAKEDNFVVPIDKDYFRPRAYTKLGCLEIGHTVFFRNCSSYLTALARNLFYFLCLCLPIWTEHEPPRVLRNIHTEHEVLIRRGCLVHLRYLTARIDSDSWLWLESISKLLNLETLDLKVDSLCVSIQLPLDIFKMIKLRHLYSEKGVFEYHCSSEKAAWVGFGHSSKLDSLQTLHRLCACKDCQNFLVRTPNLRKLGLLKMGRDFMLPDLEFLKCLETLTLTFVSLTEGLKLPLSIKRLTLEWTRLKWEELSILQNLPSLEVLKFKRINCEGPVWNTSEEGFPQLKYLHLSLMYGMKGWNASEDQFPRLEVLVLQDCRNLERIPIDFANLNELREIKLFGCTQSVEESAREIQEEQKYRKGDDDCPNLIVIPLFAELGG